MENIKKFEPLFGRLHEGSFGRSHRVYRGGLDASFFSVVMPNKKSRESTQMPVESNVLGDKRSRSIKNSASNVKPEPKPTSEASASGSGTGSPQKPKKKKTGMIIAIAAACMALFVGVLAFSGVFDNSDADRDALANTTSEPSSTPNPTETPRPTETPILTDMPDQVVTFYDANFEKNFREKYEYTGPIYMSDILSFTSLTLVDCGLTDIGDIAKFRNLTQLDLFGELRT